ncbi:MAG TPA: hypothetical protein EYN67_03915 [Flavobacteriales bacterium]|nr:hypothetical protein [Flavobacteriales bacterium]
MKIGIVYVSDRYGSFPRNAVPIDHEIVNTIAEKTDGSIEPYVYVVHCKDLKSIYSRLMSCMSQIEHFSKQFDKTYCVICSGLNEILCGVDRLWASRFIDTVVRCSEFMGLETILVYPSCEKRMKKQVYDNLCFLQRSLDVVLQNNLIDKVETQIRFTDGQLTDSTASNISSSLAEYLIGELGVSVKRAGTKRRIVVDVNNKRKPTIVQLEEVKPQKPEKIPNSNEAQIAYGASRTRKRRRITKSPEVIVFGR